MLHGPNGNFLMEACKCMPVARERVEALPSLP